MATYRTIGEALADPESRFSRNLAKAMASTRVIRGEVARLQAEGLSGEQAWTVVMRRVRPV